MERSYYAILPANVRYSQNVCDGAKLLYAEITALSNERGYCWATNKYFAALYGKSPDTISRWISELARAEFILTIADSAAGNSRKIWLWESQGIGKNADRVPAKTKTPYRQKTVDPIGKNAEQNNTVNNKKEKGEGNGKKIPPPDYDSFMSEVERLAVEAKKEKPPQVAQDPPTIYSGFDEVFDYIESQQPGIFDGQPTHTVTTLDTDIIPGNLTKIVEGVSLEDTTRETLRDPVSLTSRPNAQTPGQLEDAMRNFYMDWPNEWTVGVLDKAKGARFTAERRLEIIGTWACYAIKTNQGNQTYGQLNADVQKWFRGQDSFDRMTAPKNGNSQPVKTEKTVYRNPVKPEKIPAYTP